MNSTTKLYERDFYAWTLKNAELLRQGRLGEIDLEHLAEELDSMGRSEKRELINRLAVLLAHLLKWRIQANRRGRSWQLTLKEQRRQTTRVLRDNPSLKPLLAEIVVEAYEDAILRAAQETGMEESAFPAGCPFTIEQILEEDFLPD
ncbi:MAG: DUF29 domain-containing protein [Candidatus Contendobacter sp.]|nr:MAG: DUF29 domain-containing protein [Candidatus Contendobacter sp.]